MTTIYFVRHAQPDFSVHNDMERLLTQKGKESSKLVTEYLANKKIEVILSSPYKRAVDTVQGFADTCHLPIKMIYDFRERAVDGEWIQNFSEFVEKQWEDFSYKLEGGESLQEVQERTVAALKNILQKYRGKNIVIGSHGTAISTIMNYYDKSFGLEQFNKIVGIMPFVIRMDFDEEEFCKAEFFDLLDNSTNNNNFVVKSDIDRKKAYEYIGNTNNLAIRLATPQDAKQLCIWWNDGKVMAHAGFPKGLNTTEDEIIEKINSDDDNNRRLILEINSISVGEMVFRIKNNIAEIGIKICDFTYQDNGYGTKAIKLLIEYLFKEKKVQKIILDTNRKNTRAQHVYEKIGFIKVQEHIDAWQDQIGELQSFVDYELSKEVYYRQETVLRNMAAIYLMYDNQVLMLKRIGSRLFANPIWIGTGGGHFEQAELNHPMRCMLREIKEEIGLEEKDMQDIELKYITICNIKGEIRQIYYYFGQLKEKPIISFTSNEGELQWVNIDNVLELEMPFTARACLKHYIEEGKFDSSIYNASATNKDGMPWMKFTELLQY